MGGGEKVASPEHWGRALFPGLSLAVQRLTPAPCSAGFCLLLFIAWKEIIIPGVNGLFDSKGTLCPVSPAQPSASCFDQQWFPTAARCCASDVLSTRMKHLLLRFLLQTLKSFPRP